MFDQYIFLQESASILAGSDEFSDVQKMIPILEDTTSPITVRHTEQLYQSVIDKGHIDFGDIAKSKGNIQNYSGYSNMKETLNIIRQLSVEQRKPEVTECVGVVLTAIQNIEMLEAEYEEGFRKNVSYVMLEYNSFVFCCVEATTSILSEYVEYIKNPASKEMTISLKNNKYRANLFYLEQLRLINKVNDSPEYRKFLQSMNDKGQENFTGAAIVGMTATMLMALSIVPITRKLIFTFYDARRRLANDLMMQASFLELHRTCVESNIDFSPEKKKQILDKQEKVRLLLIKLADKVKIQNVQAQRNGERDIKKSNQLMTLDNTQASIDNGGFNLL